MEFLINVEPGRKIDVKKTLVGSRDLPDGLILEDRKIICEKDGAEMVFIPAGEFVMGSDGRYSNEGPSHSVYLDAYYIDKYEVTNAKYRKFFNWIEATKDHSKCHEKERDRDHTPLFGGEKMSDSPRQPVVGVNWYDAYSYAAWAGKSLPYEAEWEKAARGKADSVFPWGNSEPNALRAVHSSEALRKVGPCPAGISPYGCYDMSDNAVEWCSDWYDETYYKISSRKNPTGPMIGGVRVLRGGGWSFFPNLIRCSFRIGEKPAKRYDYYGFRCVQRLSGKR